MKNKNKKQLGGDSNQKPSENSTQMDEQYYDNSDLKRMLKVCDSTLSRMRKAGELPYIKPRGKIYYPKSYFNKTFLEKAMKRLIKSVD